jgi:trimeric autotransporter adhesin
MKYLALLLALSMPVLAWSQVGVGASTPHASAALELSATDKGFLPPRMTAAQRTAIGTPATGLMVYQTDGISGLYLYNGATWITQGNWTITSGTPASAFMLVSPAGVTSGAMGNIAIGVNAMSALTDGDNNVALGYDAAKSLTNMISITAVGYSALSNTNNNSNTAMGSSAGTANYFGYHHTMLGMNAQPSSSAGINATGVGYGATASNWTVRLGNSSVTNVNTSGTITTSGSLGIGTASPASNSALEVSSTSKGLLLPRLTTTERNAISSPPSGLWIYNTTTSTFQCYANGSWTNL